MTPGMFLRLSSSARLKVSVAALRGVLLAWQAVAGGDEVIGTIAEIGVAHLFEAAQQQAGCGDKNNRDRDFRDDEAGAETRMTAAGGTGASALL